MNDESDDSGNLDNSIDSDDSDDSDNSEDSEDSDDSNNFDDSDGSDNSDDLKSDSGPNVHCPTVLLHNFESSQKVQHTNTNKLLSPHKEYP